MTVPTRIVLGHLLAHLFRFPLALVGRLHRRRAQSQVALQRPRTTLPAQWWTGEPRWCPTGPPPRQHNRLTPLVDGQTAFAAMLEAIRGAQHYVYIVGWALTPTFALDPEAEDGLVATTLAAVSKRIPVKILVWSGSTLLFPPSQRLTALTRDQLRLMAPAVECRLDNRAHPTHCHHQKAVVVDGQIAFVGGLDLTTLAGNRWDVSAHPLRFGPNWHDVAVRIEGEAVVDVESNFIQRWGAVSGVHDLPRVPARVDSTWSTPCQVVRTVPRKVYPFAPAGEFGIAHAYLAAIATAQHVVYIENQYIWSPEIVAALIAAMERNVGRPFRIVVVLPARAYLGKYDNDQHVAALSAADGGRGMFSAYTLYGGGPSIGLTGFRMLPVYVHAKVAIVDDAWYTVGSGNLNARGLATDTEMNVQALDAAGARALRLRLWAEHLAVSEAELADADPIEVIDRIWMAKAAEVQRTVAQGWGALPAHVHPYQVGHMPGTRLLEHIEAALVEGF